MVPSVVWRHFCFYRVFIYLMISQTLSLYQRSSKINKLRASLPSWMRQLFAHTPAKEKQQWQHIFALILWLKIYLEWRKSKLAPFTVWKSKALKFDSCSNLYSCKFTGIHRRWAHFSSFLKITQAIDSSFQYLFSLPHHHLYCINVFLTTGQTSWIWTS